MDQLKKSFKKQQSQSTGQKSDRARPTTPTKQQKGSRSRSKNRGAKESQASKNKPLVAQLDHLKSTYTSKLASIQTGLEEKQGLDVNYPSFKNEALNIAQLTKDHSPSPQKERQDHLTFAADGETEESPRQETVPDDRPLTCSDNEYRFTRAKDDPDQRPEDQPRDAAESSRKKQATPSHHDDEPNPTGSLIERQMMKLKQSQQSRRSKHEKQKSSRAMD